ncbi:MAG: hypothetical protein QNJ38_18825 [Prochloraceae cyanobacterium]|nr:hypothetical protein [Prochloraceae cyanobacterium]
MKDPAINEAITKKWNVSLRVSLAEEKQIKISAIKRGMGVGDYIKKIVLEDLSKNPISAQGKSEKDSITA